MASAASAVRPSRLMSSRRRNTNATAISIAARPALNRKNFTPASRDTSARVKTIPIARCVRKRKRTSSAQPFVDLGPVHDVPPRVDVVGPAVLVLQVVGVLPDVDAEDRLLAFHQRAVLVRGALDGQLAAAFDHPRPAAAEASGR